MKLGCLRETNRPNFTFIMDTGQWEGSPGAGQTGPENADDRLYDYMEKVAPYASHVRAKIYKIDEGKEEWLDYPRIFTILKSIRYNGSVGIVLEGSDRNGCSDRESIKRAVKYLRRLIVSVD